MDHCTCFGRYVPYLPPLFLWLMRIVSLDGWGGPLGGGRSPQFDLTGP